MSESSGEKTEQPTPKKIQDSRQKGQVAQSQDVNKLFVTLVGIELFISMHANLLADIKRLFDLAFKLLQHENFTDALSILVAECLDVWLGFIIVLLLAIVLARFCAGFVQFGFLIAPESLKMDVKKFSPVTNAKNLFSKKKLVELASNIMKAIILTLIFSHVIRSALPYVLLLPNTGLESSIQFSIDIFSQAARLSLGFFFIVSVIDYKLQKSIFIKSMMMTKDEVFREYKQSEGDPMTKGMRRALGRELASSGGGTVKKEVEKSDVVVVNPTHFAVAIEYKPGETPLPIIRVKGVDDRAKDIIAYAQETNTPVIRYITLARYLFRVGQEHKYIPRPSLQAMAMVFRVIMEAKEQGVELEDFHDLTDE